MKPMQRHWLLSHSAVSDFATPGTVARQTPLSMGFSRQEYWSRLPFPSPGDLPDLGIQPMSLTLAGGFFTTSTSWEAQQDWWKFPPPPKKAAMETSRWLALHSKGFRLQCVLFIGRFG